MGFNSAFKGLTMFLSLPFSRNVDPIAVKRFRAFLATKCKEFPEAVDPGCTEYKLSAFRTLSVLPSSGNYEF